MASPETTTPEVDLQAALTEAHKELQALITEFEWQPRIQPLVAIERLREIQKKLPAAQAPEVEVEAPKQPEEIEVTADVTPTDTTAVVDEVAAAQVAQGPVDQSNVEETDDGADGSDLTGIENTPDVIASTDEANTAPVVEAPVVIENDGLPGVEMDIEIPEDEKPTV